jgi:hypothetical protein
VAPKAPSPPPSPTLASALATGSPTLDELDLLADEGAADSDEERLIEKYKRQRLLDMRKDERATRRFGEVYPIGREDYTREVTEGSKAEESDEDSKVNEEGETWRGTGVICFLYQDGLVVRLSRLSLCLCLTYGPGFREPASVRLASQLRTVAARYPRTKIVSIVGNKCIENYPDRHLPTLFLYRNGTMRRQFTAYGKDRPRTVEGSIACYVLCSTSLIYCLRRAGGIAHCNQYDRPKKGVQG